MTPVAIVDMMMSKDKFSQWLGIVRLGESEGKCKLKMLVREEMCNGFEIAHGAITYALADSALAFASNSHGRKSVSIETSISHILPVKAGDELTAVAEEKNLANRLAIYEVTITNQDGRIVALFKGTVFRKDETWKS
jgi:acyl-CoA thioesterase